MSNLLDRKDAFNLMKDFLDDYWKSTGRESEDIASLLSSLGRGGPSNYLPLDLALWQSWNKLADNLEYYTGPE